MNPPHLKCEKCPRSIPNRRNSPPLACCNCKLNFHYKCSGLSQYDLHKISVNGLDWTCLDCTHLIFPFTSIDNNDLISLNNIPNVPKNENTKCCKKCAKCRKKIFNNFPYFFCKSCNNCYHLKCSFDNHETYKKLANWQCDICVSKHLPFANVNDNDFNMARHGFSDNFKDTLSNLPSFTIQSLLDKMPGQSFSTDDFLSSSIDSKYYTPSDFIDSRFSVKPFSVIHLNIASLQCHIVELRTLLSLLKHPFDIICISETRLHDKEPPCNIEIEGYKFIHEPTSTPCGGVGIYIKSSIDYEPISKYTLSEENIVESIFIELKNPHKKNIIVGCIYRHHTPIQDFISGFFNTILSSITKSHKTCLLLGDFNIDLAKYGTHNDTDHFYDIISSSGFRPLILQPTRVKSSSATLIDNIFINELDCFSKGGNITCSISDHFLQFAQLDIFNKVKPKNTPTYSRNWRIFNKDEFKNELLNTNWTSISNHTTTTDQAFDTFYFKIEKLLDEMAPYKKLTKKEVGLKKSPWITCGILNSMKVRDSLYKKLTLEKDQRQKDILKGQYNIYRNKVVSLLRTSKKQYYTNYFKEHNSNIKKTWQGIRNLINVSKKSTTRINKIIYNNQDISDNLGISNTLNTFFTGIGSSVEAKIPNSKKPFQDYLINSSNNITIESQDCTVIEISNIIKNMNVAKACGPFSIPTKILKEFSSILSPLLTCIINKSIKEGTFPNLLKSSLVCPIFKKNDKSCCANYRPISLISNISKVFERVIYNRIDAFLDENNLIYNLQFGFRKKHSTDHALLSIVEKIRSNMDNQIFSCGVFVDLEKAFDTVNHSILTNKLQHYGINGKTNDWISSYLTDRSQKVSANGATSTTSKVTCGVPQGSILGPLLFIIYINDMHSAVSKSTVYHFADDTNLLYYNKDPKQLSKVMNRDLATLYDWLCANRLSLNVAKTEFTIFKPPHKVLESRITLKLAGKKIFESPKVKYLGIILDSKLCWKTHINELSKKLGRTVGMLYKIRHQSSKHVLRSLYFSLFESHLSYALPVWGSATKVLLQNLIILQKKAIRAISFSEYHAHTSPIFKQLGILKLEDLFKYKVSSLMWDFDHDNLPPVLNSLFKRTRNIHSHQTRFAEAGKLGLEKTNTRYGDMSFKVIGANILNESKDKNYYKDSLSKVSFLKKYKKIIFDTY